MNKNEDLEFHRTEIYKSMITSLRDHTFVYFLLGIHATYSTTELVKNDLGFYLIILRTRDYSLQT